MKKILVVEDNLAYAELLEKVLTKAGYETRVLSHSLNILPHIVSENPDLVILDIMLPKKSGLTVLEEMKKNESTKKIPVFCLTNLPEEIGREKALALGAYCYLTKAHYNVSDVAKHVDFYFKEKV